MTPPLFTHSGFGLHTGRPTSIYLKRIEGPQLGWRSHIIDAQSAMRCDGILSTTLHHPQSGQSLATVEHWLAACVGLGLGGISLELHDDGPTLPKHTEVPALDGSAFPIAQALLPHIHTLEALPRWHPPRPISVTLGDTSAQWLPPHPEDTGDSLHIHYTISFPHHIIQSSSLEIDLSDPYETLHQILPARTFTIAQDLAQVRARQSQGIGAGLRSGQALVAGPHSWLHGTPLVWPNEPVRHKILDLLGDLGTLGVRPSGQLRVSCGGHATHRALARAASAWMHTQRT